MINLLVLPDRTKLVTTKATIIRLDICQQTKGEELLEEIPQKEIYVSLFKASMHHKEIRYMCVLHLPFTMPVSGTRRN